MKAIFALATVSLALPACAQVTTSSSGAAAPSGAATIAGPAGAGTVNVGSGTLTAPINPGGLRGLPPPAVGQTFSRPFTAPLGEPNSLLTPGARALTPGPGISPFGFPPPEGAVTPIVTNTGIGGFVNGSTFSPPDAATFPLAPTTVGNTVGQNFVTPGTNFPPDRALSVNLPPGSVLQTNAFGVPNPNTPPPGLVPATPANTIGAPAGAERGSVGPVGTRPIIQPPAGPVPSPVPVNPGARLPKVAH